MTGEQTAPNSQSARESEAQGERVGVVWQRHLARKLQAWPSLERGWRGSALGAG